jgi:FMN phosphatase YigB (HAD superfamily)
MACAPLILGALGAAVQQGSRPMPRVVLFDVMDTLVVDPFFTGMHSSVFGCESLKELFAAKDPQTFIGFESGAITEAECHARYFLDRRPQSGDAVRAHLRANYKWVEGMHELCEELRSAGVRMAICSNYPAPWAALLEETMGLSRYAEWVSVSGRTGYRKPAPQAYTAAIESIKFESAAQCRSELRAHFPEVRHRDASGSTSG